MNTATRGVHKLNFARAGACFLSARAVSAALEQGLLPYHQPRWSLRVDDLVLGLVVQAASFTVEPFGAVASEPVASRRSRQNCCTGGWELCTR